MTKEELIEQIGATFSIDDDEAKRRASSLKEAILALAKQENTLFGITALATALGVLLGETVYATTFPNPQHGLKMAEEGGKMLGDKIVSQALIQMLKINDAKIGEAKQAEAAEQVV